MLDEFGVKDGNKEDLIMSAIVIAFCLVLVGIAFGYAWAINAYGVQI
jgi:hypothetical protein